LSFVVDGKRWWVRTKTLVDGADIHQLALWPLQPITTRSLTTCN